MAKKKTSKDIDKKSRDVSKFREDILDKYAKGKYSKIPADEQAGRSLMPPGTAKSRSFAFVGSEIPVFHSDKCVACMECIIECPDVALHARATTAEEMERTLDKIKDKEVRERLKAHFGKTTKLWNVYEKKGKTPAMFSIWVDPDKCKGCAACVAVCGGHEALSMTSRDEAMVGDYRKEMDFLSTLPETPKEFINERLFVDMFLRPDVRTYEGGAGSCSGCGEITGLNMAMTATAAKYGKNFVIVAATGCNSVYSSTYPYSIFDVPWTNSLFENAAPTALGVRLRLDQTGKKDTKVWAVGGDGAMFDIGFQSLSRVLTSQRDINILVLDTQAYSNTGGQTSGATYTGQNAKMSAHGKAISGKMEDRKELGLIAMMHPDVFVAQVSPGYINHYLRAVSEAIDYPGPSVIIAYSACMPEHGISDDAAYDRAKAAVISRAFPLYTYDPRKGDSMKERLDLKGNPSVNEDWHKDKNTGEVYDFVWFASGEGRFAKQFKNGKPSETLLQSQENRVKNWRLLKEFAGLSK
ncbi:thiamine pyrophosphate-dependent enzyme [Bdellovibrionota bacterium]